MTSPRRNGPRVAAVLLLAAMMASACGTRLDPDAVRADAASQNLDGPAPAASPTVAASSPTSAPTTSGARPAATPTTSGPDAPAPSVTETGPAPVAPVNGRGVTDTEIRIGITAPLSGITAFMGDETVGPVNAYFDHVNLNQGGVDGRQLRVISYDDRGDPTQTLTNVKRLVEEDDVFMIIGVFTDASLEYVRQQGVPLQTFGGTAPPFSSRYPTVFPILGNALTFQQEGAYSLVNHANMRPQRVAILYDTETFDVRGYLDHFRATWERVGAQVVTTDPLNLSDGDCTSLALKVQSLDVDFWDFQGLGWVHCIPAMERIGWRPPMGMGGWVTALPAFGNIVGPNIAGVWTPSTADLLDGAPREFTAAHQEYQDLMAQFAPSLATREHLESPGTVANFVGAKLIVDGLRAIAPAYTRERLVQWLHALEDYDVGIQPPIAGLAPDCKRGAGGTWWAHWQWDDEAEEAFRRPETPYVNGPWTDEMGGPCYITRIADELVDG